MTQAILAPDGDAVIAMAQWLSEYGTPTVSEPEHQLCYAMLVDAIYVLANGPKGHISQREFVQDVRWVQSENIKPFSFAFIWELLFPGWPVARARRHILGRAKNILANTPQINGKAGRGMVISKALKHGIRQVRSC